MSNYKHVGTIDKKPLLTNGEFTLITGESKSGKSNLLVDICAKVLPISQYPVGNHFNNVSTNWMGEKTIMLIDTNNETSKLDTLLNRLLEKGNITHVPQNLCWYNLTDFTPNQRLSNLLSEIEISENVGIILIDGIENFVENVNDESESHILLQKLSWYAETLNVPIVMTMTLNNEKVRGQLGTRLDRTCTAHVRTFKRDNSYQVEPVYLRF